LGALGEKARIFIFIFIFLLTLASLKELSEINKHVLEHLLEGLVFRKEECGLSYWEYKKFPRKYKC
jgi:hypothetical protein